MAAQAFKLNTPVTTDTSTVDVENDLKAGTHVFTLVVVDEMGNQSAPTRATVVVRDGTVGPVGTVGTVGPVGPAVPVVPVVPVGPVHLTKLAGSTRPAPKKKLPPKKSSAPKAPKRKKKR